MIVAICFLTEAVALFMAYAGNRNLKNKISISKFPFFKISWKEEEQ